MAATKTTQKAVRKTPKARKGAWFVPVRGSYLPASIAGWLTYIPFIAYLLFTMIVAWEQASSHLVAVLYIVPNWVAATAVLTWVARRTA